MNLIYILLLSYNTFSFAWKNQKPDIKLSRRVILSNTLVFLPFKTLANTNEFDSNITTIPQLYIQDDQIKINNNDPYAHWSFFGLAAPPIERSISYVELIKLIKNNKIFSVQIAIQHNCIIATTKEGHRLSCLLADKYFQDLILDSIDKDGRLPIKVLPIDPIRTKIRNGAQSLLVSSCLLYIAADLDLIDIDTTSYGSIKERDKIYDSGKKKEKFLKSLLDKFSKKIKQRKYDKDLDFVLGINRTKNNK